MFLHLALVYNFFDIISVGIPRFAKTLDIFVGMSFLDSLYFFSVV